MICFRGEQSWRLPSYKVKQFYFTAEDTGSAVIHVYDEAGNVIEAGVQGRFQRVVSGLAIPRPNQHVRTVPKLQWCGHSSDSKHLNSTTPAFAGASESAQNRRMGRWPSSNRPATLLDCSWCNRWHSTFHRWQTHGDRNVHLPLRE